MPKYIPTLLSLLFVTSFAQAGGLPTEAEFLAALKTAFIESSAEKLNKLYYKEGMSDADQKQVAEEDAMVVEAAFNGNADQRLRALQPISLLPLPEGFSMVSASDGKLYEPTHQPVGIVQIAFKTEKENATMEFPYTVVQGKYYLATAKSKDLGWSGPPDHELSLQVSGTGAHHLKLAVRYNASGLSFSHVSESPSSILRGQYVEEVTVTSADPKGELTLQIKEDDKEIFHSEPVKAPGQIRYQRKK